MKKSSFLSLSNWHGPSPAGLVMASGIVGSLTAFAPQLLDVLHEAPFPVSETLDAWIAWVLKVSTVILALLTIFTKHGERTESPTDIVAS